jgi:hypothetical protein
LQILIEGGVVLLIPWLALIGLLLRELRRLAKASWELAQFATVLLAIWITVLVAGLLTEDTLGTTAVMFIVLALTGSLQGAGRSVAVGNPQGEVG